MGITNKQRGTQMFPGGIHGLASWVDVPIKPEDYYGYAGLDGPYLKWTPQPSPFSSSRYCVVGNFAVWSLVLAGMLSGTPDYDLYIASPVQSGVETYGMSNYVSQSGRFILGWEMIPDGNWTPKSGQSELHLFANMQGETNFTLGYDTFYLTCLIDLTPSTPAMRSASKMRAQQRDDKKKS